MRANFIPLDDNVNKLIAFTPSLDKNYRNHQKISSKEYQIETLDVIDNLRKEGWKIKGSYQNLSKKTRQIDNHTIKMEHPDFNVLDIKGQTEAISNLTITNSSNGKSPLSLNLGVYRMVCGNGAIARDTIQCQNINHTSKDYYKLDEILASLNIKTQSVIKDFQSLQQKDLTNDLMFKMAAQSAKIRDGDKYNFNPNQLLNVVRDEDKGNSLWTVFNRIQENLTQSNRLVDLRGNHMSGINSIPEDIRVNKQLSELAYSYM
jgi:hypothetical protein